MPENPGQAVFVLTTKDGQTDYFTRCACATRVHVLYPEAKATIATELVNQVILLTCARHKVAVQPLTRCCMGVVSALTVSCGFGSED